MLSEWTEATAQYEYQKNAGVLKEVATVDRVARKWWEGSGNIAYLDIWHCLRDKSQEGKQWQWPTLGAHVESPGGQMEQ